MKKIFFFLLVSATLFACSKNTDGVANPGTPGDVSYQIKKSSYNTGTTTYTYDASGRIKTKTYLGGERSEFEYQAGKVLEKEYDAAGILKVTYTYELNSNGIVEKETRSDMPGFSEIRLYNSDKQMVKFTIVENGGTSTGDYFYSNGNCDSARFSSNGIWNTTIKNTYYTDKANVLGFESSGQFFWGKKSKNLIKSEQYFFSNGSVGEKENYSYEYDAKGRVTKFTSEADNDLYITFYSYE